jgi:hypothetical protein
MSRSLALFAFDGIAAESLRASASRLADLRAELAVFEGTSGKMGAPVPSVLAVVRTELPAGEETLAKLAAAFDAAPTMRASFAYIRSFGAHAGEPTRGVLMGMTDCASPEVRAEFDRWYDEHHAIDVVRSGLYFVAERHQRVAGDAPEFLAIYATSGEEPETFERYFAWEQRDTTRTKTALVRNVWTFRFAFASPEVITWN